MKKLRNAVLLATVILFTGVFLACPTGGGGGGTSNSNQTPSADDYTVTGLEEPVPFGTAFTVNIEAKSGKSPGGVTVKYNDNTAKPSAIGIYLVTFDVAEADGWNPASKLAAGVLNIIDPGLNVPSIDHYQVTGTGNFVYEPGKKREVTITKLSGASPGSITVKYTKGNTVITSPDAPIDAGTYIVTFDVGEATGWNPLSGIHAGVIVIAPLNALDTKTEYFDKDGYKDPNGQDWVYDESPKRVSITAQATVTVGGQTFPGTTGKVTIIYTKGNTVITSIPPNYNDAPIDAGEWVVTFDVEGSVVGQTEQTAWSNAVGLSAGSLVIKKATPVLSKSQEKDLNGDFVEETDYSFDTLKLVQTIKDPANVTIANPNGLFEIDVTPASNRGYQNPPTGVVNYDGAPAMPSTRGTYPVTYVISGENNWEDTALEMGDLVLNEIIDIAPVISYYWIENGVLVIGNVDKTQVIANGFELEISSTGTGTFTGQEWWVDGVKKAEGADSFTFSSINSGWHNVTLSVIYDGKLYSETYRVYVNP